MRITCNYSYVNRASRPASAPRLGVWQAGFHRCRRQKWLEMRVRTAVSFAPRTGHPIGLRPDIAKDQEETPDLAFDSHFSASWNSFSVAVPGFPRWSSCCAQSAPTLLVTASIFLWSSALNSTSTSPRLLSLFWLSSSSRCAISQARCAVSSPRSVINLTDLRR